MPIHDWTRVMAGTFHDFHHCWIAELRRCLNRGVLPPGYYAQAERVATQVAPEVLTPQEPDPGLAASEAMIYAACRGQLAIRHENGHRVVALIELVSPGNKETRGAVEQFVDKVVAALDDGLHLHVVDLFPPGRFDPAGMHGAIWSQVGGRYDLPAGKPLTVVAYAAAAAVTYYAEPLAVGGALVDTPLFLTPDRYVNVPLEQAYMAAYEDVPNWWKRVLEPAA